MRTMTSDIAGLQIRASRRRLMGLTAAAGAMLALASCNGQTAQQVVQDVITMFQNATNAITAFLSQIGIPVPASIVSLLSKIQSVASQVVAGITALAASGFVQQAFGYFQQIVALVTSALGGSLPGAVSGAVGVIMQAFSWLMSALGIAKPAALASAPAPANPDAIIAQLQGIIAAAR